MFYCSGTGVHLVHVFLSTLTFSIFIIYYYTQYYILWVHDSTNILIKSSVAITVSVRLLLRKPGYRHSHPGRQLYPPGHGGYATVGKWLTGHGAFSHQGQC